MKDLIQKLVQEVLSEINEPNITIYFDMDGVLADFEGSVHKDLRVVQAEKILNELLRQAPELASLHNDELRDALRGPQEDPLRKRIKKAFNQYRELSFAVAGKPGHFVNLDMLPGAREMLKVASKLTGKLPHILTAPMESNPRCEEEKFTWVNKNLSGLFDGFHCTQNKDHFAQSKWDILIDDRPKYVNKFRAAGGTAILHTDPSKTIKELSDIIKNLRLNKMDEQAEKKSRELDEFNAMGTGAVVGYTLPLGMKPDYDKMGTGGKKKKRPQRWYDVAKESKEVNEEYIGSKGGLSYFQLGGSLPDELYNLDKDGKPTRDPGVPGLKKKKIKKKKTK